MVQFRDNGSRIKTIACPVCGREYLPAEIYIPSAFFGNPKNIERIMGKIDFFEGDSLNTEEEYTCDGCGTTFTVNADIRFQTKEKEKSTFDEEYVTPIRNQRISLFEGNE